MILPLERRLLGKTKAQHPIIFHLLRNIFEVVLYGSDENKKIGKEIRNISNMKKTRYDNIYVQNIKIKKPLLRQKLKFIIPSRTHAIGNAKKKFFKQIDDIKWNDKFQARINKE